MTETFKTGIANAAIADGLVVAINASVADGVKLPAAVTDFAFGVTYGSTTASGQAISVQTEGEARVVASATVTRGQLVKYGTDGKILPVAAGGDKALGVCTVGAGAGEFARVYISRVTN